MVEFKMRQCDLYIHRRNSYHDGCVSSRETSVLDGIGTGEDTVLVVTLSIGILTVSWLSLLGSFVSVSAPGITLTSLNVLESLLETVLDVHDVSGSFIEEGVDI